MQLRFPIALLFLVTTAPLAADWNTETLKEAPRFAPKGAVAIPYGITPSNTRLYCFADPEVLLSSTPKKPLLIVGSFSGGDDEGALTGFVKAWSTDFSSIPNRESWSLVTIPIPDPDQFMLTRLLALWPGQEFWWSPHRPFPPTGTYYEQTDHVADQYLCAGFPCLAPR